MMDEGNKPKARKLTVVTDQQGRVVGAAVPDDSGEMRIGMVPLDGQSLHEVDVPVDLAELMSPQMLSAAMEDASLDARGKLKVRKQKMEK